MTVDDIRAAAERLINEATLHRVESGPDPLSDDILLVVPAALAGLDMQAELERLRSALERIGSSLTPLEDRDALTGGPGGRWPASERPT